MKLFHLAVHTYNYSPQQHFQTSRGFDHGSQMDTYHWHE